ncbi:MAG: hypothetical protein VX642_11330 [Bdellovibrionota bacterium]|nr:hypothetical protein [Bdellovibrionota bacterium]
MRKYKISLNQKIILANLALLGAVFWSLQKPASTYKLSESYETRSIASIQPKQNEKTSIEKFREMIVYQLDCNSDTIDTQAEYIRLEINECLNVSKLNHKIINHRTGSQAIIFNLPSKRLSTDFLKLRSGTNKIELQWMNSDGQIEVREFNIERT